MRPSPPGPWSSDSLLFRLIEDQYSKVRLYSKSYNYSILVFIVKLIIQKRPVGLRIKYDVEMHQGQNTEKQKRKLSEKRKFYKNRGKIKNFGGNTGRKSYMHHWQRGMDAPAFIRIIKPPMLVCLDVSRGFT